MITIEELIDPTALKILDFFSNNNLFSTQENREFDEILINEFENIYLQAAEGLYDHWLDYPHETLALIIVLNQIPRLIYTNSTKAYSTDEEALEIAKYALKQKINLVLKKDIEKIFLYLPFMQSEKLKDQEISIKEFANINKNMIEIANFHYKTILNFKRFPTRNSIFNRESSNKEIIFLNESDPSYFKYI